MRGMDALAELPIGDTDCAFKATPACWVDTPTSYMPSVTEERALNDATTGRLVPHWQA